MFSDSLANKPKQAMNNERETETERKIYEKRRRQRDDQMLIVGG